MNWKPRKPVVVIEDEDAFELPQQLPHWHGCDPISPGRPDDPLGDHAILPE